MKCILTSTANFHHDYAYDVISTIIKPCMKVVCLPFASELSWQIQGDDTDFFEKHYVPFSKFGICESDFYVVRVNDEVDYIKEQLEDADIIYFSGGFMENIMFILKVLQLDEFIKEFAEEKIFIGESAGTLILQDEYMETPHIEDHYKHYHRKEGLGIISGYDLLVHYDKTNKLHQINFKVLTNRNKENKQIVGISDEGALIIDGDKVIYLGECIK